MSRTAAFVLVFACALVVLAPPASAQYSVSAQVTTPFGPLDRTEYTVVFGPNPIEQFKAVHIAAPARRARPQTLLLLPPLGVNHGFYEQTDPHRGIGSSIAGFFALRGYDVWQYVSPMEGIPGGTCEAGLVDCSPMAGWNMAKLVDDAAFVRGLLEAESPGAEVYTGGTSLGGMLALAVVDDAPGDYAGAIVWEGSLSTPNPAVQAHNQPFCAQLEALLAAGIHFDGTGGPVLKTLVRQSELVPGGLTSVPLLPPFLTNRQAMVSSFTNPPPGPVSTPVPGYYFLAGDPVAGTFDYASTERLTTNVERFVDYSPTALIRDVSCSLAGVETSYVDNLGAFTGRVLGIGGGGGFGPIIPDNLALFTSAAEVDFLLEPAFGHIDHFMAPDHARYVERPIRRWLEGLEP